MDSVEYVEHVRRTFNPSLSQIEQLLNYSLGMANEMLEVHEVEIRDCDEKMAHELGDVAWYTAASAAILFSVKQWPLENEAYPAQRLPRPMRDMTNLSTAVKNYSELVKKFVFHGKPCGLSDFLCALREVWAGLRDVCPMYCAHSLSDVLSMNVAKIQKRWPDGFVPQTVTPAADRLAFLTMNDIPYRLPGDAS